MLLVQMLLSKGVVHSDLMKSYWRIERKFSFFFIIL
jgi:hypothetical protein